MNVEVRFFASLADATGTARTSVEIAGGADVEALWDALVERYPALATTSFKPLVACDMEYSGWDTGLDGIAEVAFLPPVSGG